MNIVFALVADFVEMIIEYRTMYSNIGDLGLFVNSMGTSCRRLKPDMLSLIPSPWCKFVDFFCTCTESETTFNLFKRRKSQTVETSEVDQDDQEPEPAQGALPEAEVNTAPIVPI